MQDERGQAMVELAIVLPLVLLVVLSTLSSAVLLHSRIAVNFAARAAVRELSISGNVEQTKLTFVKTLQDAGVATANRDDTMMFIEVVTTDSSSMFSVIYFQKSLVPWVDRMLWPVDSVVNGHSKPGTVPFFVKLISTRE